MSEIIAIANQKGGVGKTTTAINLAYALSCLDQQVLLVDLDPQANATSGVGTELNADDKTVYDVICGNAEIETTIKPSSNEFLDVLPANHNLAGAEVELVSAEGREEFLKKALDKVSAMYNFVIIDCPPSLGLLTLNALTAADAVITPVQCEYYAMEGLARFNETVSKINSFINPKLKIDGGVMTMHDARINLSNQVKDEVSKFYGRKMYKTLIPRNVRLAESPSFGQSIFAYDPACRGADAYFDLAVEFLTRRGANPEIYADTRPYIVAEEIDLGENV